MCLGVLRAFSVHGSIALVCGDSIVAICSGLNSISKDAFEDDMMSAI